MMLTIEIKPMSNSQFQFPESYVITLESQDSDLAQFSIMAERVLNLVGSAPAIVTTEYGPGS